MPARRTVLVTGSTDGIGLETAKWLAAQNHNLLLHGRRPAKLDEAERVVRAVQGSGSVEGFVADLSRLADVEAFAQRVVERYTTLDVLINNAGVFLAPETHTDDGLDIRFAVNTIAPYLLTQRLLPLLGSSGRVINVSSAAQSPVNPGALAGEVRLSDQAAYAQSKLALTMWSRQLAAALEGDGPAIVVVNPGSMLGPKWSKRVSGSPETMSELAPISSLGPLCPMTSR